jgi:transposase
MDRTRIPDATWGVLWDILYWTPGIWKNEPGRERLFVEAVVWVARTGVAWADLPPALGHGNTVQRRFRRWTELGIWQRIFDALRPDGIGATVSVDATICKAHRAASGARGGAAQALGVSRGGITTKIHAAVDGDGRVLRVVPTGGNAADCTTFFDATCGLRPAAVLADRGYDSNKIRDWLAENGIEAVIPSKKTRTVQIPHEREKYKLRHVVENVFGRFKDFCRITLRRDKTVASYMGFVFLVATLINVNGFRFCP